MSKYQNDNPKLFFRGSWVCHSGGSRVVVVDDGTSGISTPDECWSVFPIPLWNQNERNINTIFTIPKKVKCNNPILIITDFRKLMMTPRAGSGATTSLLTMASLGSGNLPFASPRYSFYEIIKIEIMSIANKTCFVRYKDYYWYRAPCTDTKTPGTKICQKQKFLN